MRAAGNGSAWFSADLGPKGPADCLVQDRGCTRRGDGQHSGTLQKLL